MATSFSGGGSQSTRREPPTMGKQLVNFITCVASRAHPLFVVYKARARAHTHTLVCPIWSAADILHTHTRWCARYGPRLISYIYSFVETMILPADIQQYLRSDAI